MLRKACRSMSVGSIGVLLACLALLPSCVTPGAMQSVNARDFKRLEAGMTVKQAQRAARTAGEPVALFRDRGVRHEIRTFKIRETGAPYHVLWVEDALRGVIVEERGRPLAERADAAALPHEQGFDVLLTPFASAVPPADIDPSQPIEGFRPRDKKQERAELLMWTPVILFSLPVMPIQLLSVGVSAEGHRPYYALDLGWPPERVRQRVGDPVTTMGDPSDYGVWVYRYEPYEYETLYVSIGFRAGIVEWIRYGYDAGSGAATSPTCSAATLTDQV